MSDGMNYAEMTSSELRNLVRERGLARGIWVAGAKKADLVALLTGSTLAEVQGASASGPTTPEGTSGSPKQPAANANGGASATQDAFAAMLLEMLNGKIKAGLDEEEVQGMIDRAVADAVTVLRQAQGNIITVRMEGRERRDRKMEGVQHQKFGTLLRFCTARNKDGFAPNIYLHGPAGTGKTTAARNIANALELPFRYTGAIDTEYKLSGFIDAQGRYLSTDFYRAWTQGGVFLFDELDASLPAALLAFNAALANPFCAFPEGTISRHKECIIIAAGNTTMRGDGFSSGFQRVAQDCALVDRFQFLEWPIDEALEEAMVPPEHATWLMLVRKCRANVRRHGIKKCDITPRATIAGIALLSEGVAPEDVIDACIRKGLPEEQWKLVMA